FQATFAQESEWGSSCGLLSVFVHRKSNRTMTLSVKATIQTHFLSCREIRKSISGNLVFSVRTMVSNDEAPFLFSDLALARRLERAEAQSNARFVEARGLLYPESGARWIEVAGAYAMFDKPAHETSPSPATQTFGLGLFRKVTSHDMERIEQFFQE